MAAARHTLILLLCLVFSGCGFHLRGESAVPGAVQPLAVDCSAEERLCRAIERQLELAQVQRSSASDAAAVLVIDDFRQQRRANAVTVRASAAEYTLRQSATIQVRTADAVPLVARTTVTSADTYRNDETNVLAKQREEDQLQNDLTAQLAQQILFRLAPLNRLRIDQLREQYESQTP